MSKKWIYNYGDGKAEGNAQMRNLLGGKGCGLHEMSKIGLPVPPGFTITTEVCTYYYDHNKTYPPELDAQIKESMGLLEKTVNKQFGSETNPLLVAVRSGARTSMPGMMDTVLNLGLNDKTVEGLAQLTNNGRFAYDSYRRFIQMYSDIVLEVEHKNFEQLLKEQKEKAGVKLDYELKMEDLKELIGKYKEMVKRETKQDFPQDVNEQLKKAIHAVFGSWNNDRAITYRNLNDIPHTWGTAVNVVSMVFGNMGQDCATGVCFTRNPSTGEKAFYGEYLINAQGEDVVAGIRTPQQITTAGKIAQKSELPSMEEVMPDLYKQLLDVREKLEHHYKDMQDIEFTIQSGKLYLLQQRSGKRTAKAAVKIAVDLVSEGIVDKNQALLLVEASSINQLLHPQIDPKAEKKVFATGLKASPGAACGIIALTANKAQDEAKDGKAVILIREETSPDDITGMHVAKGIVTCRGGMTSHAAVVARGMGRPCITGAGDMEIDMEKKEVTCKGVTLKEGDWISMSGDSGEVYIGQVKTVEPEMSPEFETLMKWADETRRLKVRTNAETVKDTTQARKFGAEGIGLVRTEHMFFDPKRIISVRKMILAESEEEKKQAISELLKYQENDFMDIFRIMDGFPVTIRLLDPPLHEFLPKLESEMKELAAAINVSFEIIEKRCAALKELNPMLGNRGVRLCISKDEIAHMQFKAIFSAAIKVTQEGKTVIPEIMVPLIHGQKELNYIHKICLEEHEKITKETGVKIDYKYGTMIELPRAALMAADIAKTAQFFSFGTNDLTQTTFGISRDDFTYFDLYKHLGILDSDPFAVLDQEGVGQLIKFACENGRKTRPDLKLGICGEHGGDPKSIQYADLVGLSYVSCSPFRVPIARLAAAQATVRNNQK